MPYRINTAVLARYSPAQWEEGPKFCARVWTDGRDTYPHNFRCYVEIRERPGSASVLRVGRGRFCGNFSAIFIEFRKEKMQLTELLRRS